jgi:hypothetical protein
MVIDATIPWKYRVYEKKPGITFFTQSQWETVDLRQYFTPEQAERWYTNPVQGIIQAMPPGVAPSRGPSAAHNVIQM